MIPPPAAAGGLPALVTAWTLRTTAARSRPGGLHGVVALGPVGAQEEHAVGRDGDALGMEGGLVPVHVLGRDPRVRRALEREVEHDRLADHGLEGELLDVGLVTEEMMRRIDMRARVYRHLHHVRDEALVLPRHDGLELEVVLVLREGCGVALLHGHAQVDDPHGVISFGLRCAPDRGAGYRGSRWRDAMRSRDQA